jgi:hypothetical protein
MQERNLTDIKSLGNLTPGVNLDAGAPFSGDRSVLSASIRGIGQDDFAFNLNPGVGVYVDGVYLARTIGANQNLLDVDRVEILKGPQGTLFGANTIGGAISITTHTPGDEERFIAEATGGSYDRRDFGFTADIPIIKGVLLSSISVSSQEQTGWMKVVPYPSNSPFSQAPITVIPMSDFAQAGYGTSDTYDGQGVQVIRGKLLWNATDKLKITCRPTGRMRIRPRSATRCSTPSPATWGVHFLVAVQPLHQQQCSVDSGAIAAQANPPNVIFPAGGRPTYFSRARARSRAHRYPEYRRARRRCSEPATSADRPVRTTILNHPGTAYLGGPNPYLVEQRNGRYRQHQHHLRCGWPGLRALQSVWWIRSRLCMT